MDYIDPINQAINYIENNLTRKIAIEQVAATAGYSRYHFDRLFLDMIGETPARYIRKRRLSEAARELVTSKRPILEVALDYQFQSQEAFARPFKKMFSLSPGAYRKRRRFLRGFPKITLKERKIFRLKSWTGKEPGIIFPGEQDGRVLPAQVSAVFVYRDPTSLLNHTFDAIYLFFG